MSAFFFYQGRHYIFQHYRKICPLVWSETLSISSKNSHSTNIGEKIVNDKGGQCLCQQEVQKCKSAMGQRHPNSLNQNSSILFFLKTGLWVHVDYQFLKYRSLYFPSLIPMPRIVLCTQQTLKNIFEEIRVCYK